MNDAPIIVNQSAPPGKRKLHPAYSTFLILSGVVLPIISIAIELTIHWCAEVFFDPIPSLGHVMLVSFVPMANLWVWWVVQKREAVLPNWLGYVNALAISISACYTLVFLSLTPIAIPMILAFGMGLLALTPHFSLITAVSLRQELVSVFPTPKPAAFGAKGLVIAFAATLGFFAVMEIPRTVTRIGLHMAMDESPETQARGIRLLRSWGDRETLLRFCYVRSFRMETDIVGRLWTLGTTFDTSQVRQIYYRVTGQLFSVAVPPRGINGLFNEFDEQEVINDDSGVASFTAQRGLKLADSKIDGSIDSEAALAYLEWTLVFKNEKIWQQEAEATVQLPPDAVVSRLTLWIDGQEREAAFAAKERVTAAYELVVSKRKDPVLVVTNGRDKIRVRCFPVPPNGGEMKIRIGMSVPLVLEDRTHSILRLPYFQQRNFSVASDFTHAVWIESKQPLETLNNNLFIERPQSNLFSVRGALKDKEISTLSTSIRAIHSTDTGITWTKDTLGEGNRVIRQKIEALPNPSYAQLIFVIDTSLHMKTHWDQVLTAMSAIPPTIPWSLILAGGNGLNEGVVAPHVFTGNPKDAISQLSEIEFEGGADNVPALQAAWEIAEKIPNSAIIWIHGPQPLRLTSIEGLKQRWIRRPTSAPLYFLQVVNGTNTIASALDDIDNIKALRHFGDLNESLQRFVTGFSQLQPQRNIESVSVEEKTPLSISAEQVKETSLHLARLWARDEVIRLLRQHKPELDLDAQNLAARYQIVTPISGAVVLETMAQYQQAGLTPVASGTVPTIPEPEVYALIIIIGFVFLALTFRRRNPKPCA